MAKMIRRLGSLTSQRAGTPTSPDFARYFMNFRFNMLGLRNTLPNIFGRGSDSGANWGPCNKSGTVPVFGVGNAPGQNAPAGPTNDAGVCRINED